MKQIKSRIVKDEVIFIFDKNHTYINISVNNDTKTGVINSFKKNNQGVRAARELMDALIFIKPHATTIHLQSAPERSQHVKEYMDKYDLKNPVELRRHRQQNLNKYYHKLGFTLVDHKANIFEAKTTTVINTIKNL